MGAVAVFPMARAPVSRPVEEGRLGILDPDQEAFLDLTPLVSMRTCGICGDDEIVFYNGLHGNGKRRLRFLSYQKGHQFDEEVVPDPFALLGIQC